MLAALALTAGLSLVQVSACRACSPSVARAHAGPSQPAKPAWQFDGERARRCLDEARLRMGGEQELWQTMEATMRGDRRAAQALQRRWHRQPPSGPFAAFEGMWLGEWGTMPVRHLWVSADANAQLVIVEDANRAQRGINYRDGRGALCGLVLQPDGEERLHEGFATGAEQLLWATPERSYLERVLRANDGTHRYEIVEVEFSFRGPRLGTTTRYRPALRPATAPVPAS